MTFSIDRVYCQYMNAFSHIDCLVAAGVVTDYQGNQMKSIIGKLPTTTSDLLAIIAAAALTGLDENQFLNPPLSASAVASTGPLDPHGLSGIPFGAKSAKVTVLNDNIIYRIDGTNPVGVARAARENESFIVTQLGEFRFAGQTGSANIFVEYY